MKTICSIKDWVLESKGWAIFYSLMPIILIWPNVVEEAMFAALQLAITAGLLTLFTIPILFVWYRVKKGK